MYNIENNGIKIIKVLKQVMNAIKQRFGHEFKNMNLTGPQGMLITILSHHGDMKISDLSQKMGLSNSTVSGIVDRLENQKLVQRTRNKDDRRVINVSITSKFKNQADESFKNVEKKFESMLKNATPQELDTVIEGLNILKRLIDDNKETKSND
jgi:DNA-binding MarR family transcriptional regulator